MKLSTFIQLEIEVILREWDTFAMTLFPEKDKSDVYLFRNYAREILSELMIDMETKQSLQEQADKSKGIASPFHIDDCAANVHGILRHDDGFTVSQVAAEFRALRATVLRLWLPNISMMSKEFLAVADSIVTYNG